MSTFTRNALILGGLLYASLIGRAAASSALIELHNDTIAVRLDGDAHGAIRQIVDIASGKNFVAQGAKPFPIYTLTMTDKLGKRATVSSAEAQKVDPVQTLQAGNEVALTFTHTQPSLTVRVRVRVPDKGSLSYWRLDVENHSPLAIISADFPGFAMPQVLGSQPDDTCVIFPRAINSQRFWNLPEEFRYLRTALSAKSSSAVKSGKAQPDWPLNLALDNAPDVVQMMACYDSEAGFYLATHDPKPNVKHMAIDGLDDATMRLRIEHIRPWEFGRDFTMGYDTVVGVFHGDWTAAADIYRNWATQQSWCSQGTLAKGNKGTPEWLTQHPIYLRFVLKHPHTGGRTEWKDVPGLLENFKREYPGLYDNAIVHYVEFDTGGHWQGFYDGRWPAWMGDDVFAAEVRRVKSLGLRPCVEPFGWWITKSGAKFGRPDYNLTKQPFYPELLKNTLVWGEQEMLSAGMTNPQRTVACLASDYGRSVFVDDARKEAPWGMDLFQLMEVRHVDRMNCFNSAHGHPLGAGAWIYEKAYKIYEEVRNTGRKLNPDFCTDKEETAEFLIPVLDTVYLRDTQVKNMRWNGRPQFYKNNLPLFDYIYHEYQIMLDAFQASKPETTRWCAGLAAVLGHVTGPLFSGDPKDIFYRQAQSGGAWEITSHAHKAFNSYARRHMVFGRVLPSPGVEFPEMRQPRQNMPLFASESFPGNDETTLTDFVTPQVVQSAHLSPEGSVGLCFVNVADAAVAFELPLSKYANYFKGRTAKIAVRHNGEVVSEKTAELGASAARLKFAIQPRALLFLTLE